MAIVSINDTRYEYPLTYYMDKRLKHNLDNKIIPSLLKKDKDCVIVIDGAEGSGKSTFAFQIGKYIDKNLTIDRVVFDAESFKNAIYAANKGECVIYDEAFTGLSSRASISKINKTLISLMMQMRQKNLAVIIVMPTFFMLDKYVALFRTKALLHVYENSGRRGYFRVYNRKLKKILYLAGKNTLTYGHKGTWSNFKGRFYGVFALGNDKAEQEYRKKKEKALKETQNETLTNTQIKFKAQRDALLYLLKKTMDITYDKLSKLLKSKDIDLNLTQIHNICRVYERKDPDVKQKDLKLEYISAEDENLTEEQRKSMEE